MPTEAKHGEHFLEMLHQKGWNSSLSILSRLGLGLAGSIEDEVST